jgi:hypothetical protein
MEVHHHAHTSDPDNHRGRKKWTHYFWEFLMLFFAVFCGFLAEYQLEHTIEHQREKQYIRSLIADLKVDNQSLDAHIASITGQVSMMDSMIFLLNNPNLIAKNSSQLYYLGRVSPRFTTLTINNRTYEQLKNSGNFRLIRDLGTSDKIMAYYEKVQQIRQVEDIYNGEFNEYKRVAAKVFDPAVFREMEQDDGTIRRNNINPPLQSNNTSLLKEMVMFSVYMNGSRRGLLNFERDFQKTAIELTKYLEDEYHLSERTPLKK